MKKYLTGRFSFKTDIGKVRLSNEDQACALINASGNVLLIVCDGMGGQSKGDLASSLAINTVISSFKSRKGFMNRYFAKFWVGNVIREANKCVYEQSKSNPSYEGMGTTLTLLLIIKDDLTNPLFPTTSCALLLVFHAYLSALQVIQNKYPKV